MRNNTKTLADSIVNSLRIELKNCSLPAFKSIYVCGSYCRGDWLNKSSDLDLHTIYNDKNIDNREDDINYLKKIVEKAKAGTIFNSHCPGGIDYGFSFSSNIPKSYDEACKPSPYAYFSTLMFDLKQHHITLYGEELDRYLPETPDPKLNAIDWLLSIINRAKSLDRDDFKMPFIVYRAILAIQLIYGEITINKYKILDLYQRYIPDFDMKWFGELLIRNYLGSFYPDRPSESFPAQDYIDFFRSLSYLVENIKLPLSSKM